MSVSSQQRHTKRNRCPICGGADQDPRGKEKRCHGFTSIDGEWVRCARQENAGNLNPDDDGLYVHKMHGECRCGVQHGADNRPADEIEAVYPYHYENGEVGYEVVRKTGKRFLQRRPIGGGEYEWKLNGVRRVIYRLPEVLADDGERPVYIAEGEKDCDSLWKRGHVATCNPGGAGAGKWGAVADVARTALQGRDVIVIADNDDPGRAHARAVAATLRGVARTVRVTRCPTAKDITDHVLAGGKVEELVPLEDEQPDSADAQRPTFRIMTGAELWAPLPPPDYLVDGLLVRGSLALIVAYGASLKTWTVIDLAVAGATGTKWMGRFPTKRGPSALIDFESGDYESRRRMHRDAAGRGLQTPIEGLSLVTMPEWNLADDRFFDALRPLAETHALISIDSLAAGSGGIDENDARFAVSLQRLKTIASTTGCVIVVIHHARKGNGQDGDEREMVRGTSGIFNAADVVLQLVRHDDESFVCKQTKARGGKKVEPFIIRVTDVSDHGTVVAAADVAAVEEIGVAKTAERFTAVTSKVIQLLGRDKDVRSATEIRRRIGGNKKLVLEAVSELEERKTIVKHEGTYRLASEVLS